MCNIYSGVIFNQLWDKNVMKEEVNITRAPHLAYYKDNKALNTFNSEQDQENLVAQSNINQERLEDYTNRKYLKSPLKNFFSNCFVSDV